MSEGNVPRPRRSDPPLEELKKERDDFIKQFFAKGAEFTEELVREREAAQRRLSALEEENARLRAQIASDDAIRDLLKKIEELEREKDAVLAKYREVEALSSQNAEVTMEVESELANLANLYVASYQLHSSLSPRGVMRHVKELLGQLVGAEAFAIYLLDDAGAALVPVASEGIDVGALSAVPPGEGRIGETFLAGTTFESRTDSRAGSLAAPVICVPLRIEDRPVGVIAVFRTLEQKSAFIRIDHELFKLLGAQAMSALVAARLFSDGGRKIPPLSSFRDLGT